MQQEEICERGGRRHVFNKRPTTLNSDALVALGGISTFEINQMPFDPEISRQFSDATNVLRAYDAWKNLS